MSNIKKANWVFLVVVFIILFLCPYTRFLVIWIMQKIFLPILLVSGTFYFGLGIVLLLLHSPLEPLSEKSIFVKRMVAMAKQFFNIVLFFISGFYGWFVAKTLDNIQDTETFWQKLSEQAETAIQFIAVVGVVWGLILVVDLIRVYKKDMFRESVDKLTHIFRCSSKSRKIIEFIVPNSWFAMIIMSFCFILFFGLIFSYLDSINLQIDYNVLSTKIVDNLINPLSHFKFITLACDSARVESL